MYAIGASKANVSIRLDKDLEISMREVDLFKTMVIFKELSLLINQLKNLTQSLFKI